MKLKLLKIAFLALFLIGFSAFGQKNVWKKSSTNGTLNSISIDKLQKNKFKVFELNTNIFKQQLSNAPLRGIANSKFSNTIVNLPNEKGVLTSFRILEAPVFSPSLSVKYPNIKSYIGYSTDNTGAIVRMSVSPKGVQTMISYTSKSTVFMQPATNDSSKYIVYTKSSRGDESTEQFICSTIDELKEENNITTARDANDQILRKFRLAMSVNGEYTTYHGGTVAGALAAINATITRVNAVFETDMAVTFEIIDADQLIFTDAATDPYSGSLSAWNVELQNTLTNTIGNAAYDIGHMFGASGGGGNAGCIGCVCRDDTSSTTDKNKGSGITSPSDGIPQGDTFDIDYVAHEIGHQMGANHTFSHTTEGTGVNAEPGSGSTIMGYAGITSSNVQQHSDPYFHYHSIKQITDNVTNVRTCWQSNNPVNLTNNPPNANAGTDFVIPQGTAYVLRGSATDADGGDMLMYCWEQTDSGSVTKGQFGPTRTIGAQARSLSPAESPNRYIPKLSRIVSGNLTQTNPAMGSAWETVSTVARDLNWALTVRDREPTATGLHGQSSFDTMKITVNAASGPFTVTAPATAVTWDTGTSQTITWDVASTNIAPINSQNVNIKLSTDGGVTFPITLASNISNNGSYTMVIPNHPTTTARIMVEAADNIFLAVNSTNFTINSTTPTFIFSSTSGMQSACNTGESSASYTLDLDFVNSFSEAVSFTTTGQPSGTTVSFNPSSISADGTVTMTVNNLDGATAQAYTIIVSAASATVTRTLDMNLTIYESVSVATLTTPADGNIDEPSDNITLTWAADSNAASYDVEVAIDNAFATIISSGNVTTNSYNVIGLSQATTYYWRVKAKNTCGEAPYSAVFSFTTLSCSVCASSGNAAFSTGTTLVKFNTINNASTKSGGYSDYTAMSTEVKRNDSHDLTINVNTAGSWTTHTIVWIDWNQNCSFDDAGEKYELGTANNVTDGVTNSSPLSITIPTGASLGNTVMRVSTKYNTASTSCQTGFDGEVEDYTIIVQSATAAIEDFSFGGFNLYPNPSNGDFTLNFEVVNTDKVSVQLFDIRGRLVGEKNFFDTESKFSEKLSFSKVSKGLYLLKIVNGTKQTTRKVLIK